MSPLYLEISPLLFPKLTGVSRFAARLVESLGRRVSLVLTTFLDPANARRNGLSMDLVRGQEIRLGAGEAPPIGADVTAWARCLCRRAHRRWNAADAARASGVYTWSRLADGCFGREIGIFYDFTPLIVPWSHAVALRQEFQRQVVQSRAYHKVLAISESTKADAAWLCPVAQSDIVVGYPGPSQCVAKHAHAGRVERSANAMLVVATREPRKNGDFLLDWFLNTPALPADAELWWAGPEGWLWDGARQQRTGERASRVKFLGMVSDARLCELYQRARLTIYPSLYEGFGFPVLDSLWHGTPVLSSFNSSLQELDFPGVYYFDACDPASLDAAYRECLTRPEIIVDRRFLAARFAWDSLAETVLALAG